MSNETRRGPRTIDFAGSLPTPERMAFEIRTLFGQDGYDALFGGRWAKVLDVPEDVIRQVSALPDEGFRSAAAALLEPHVSPLADIVSGFRSAGVEKTVVHNPLPDVNGLTNDDLAARVREFPDDLLGFVRVNPADLDASLADIERLARTDGARGITLTPFWSRIRADDPALDPLWDLCQSLGLVAWVHTCVNWAQAVPMRLEHPLYIDDVATRFPDLVIMGGHGGWPWVNEMVAVAMRQPNVYIDFSAFRPKHLATPGAGWEVLCYHLSRALRRKVVFGSTWSLLGRHLTDVLEEVRGLPIDDNTVDRFLYLNAAEALRLV